MNITRFWWRFQETNRHDVQTDQQVAGADHHLSSSSIIMRRTRVCDAASCYGGAASQTLYSLWKLLYVTRCDSLIILNYFGQLLLMILQLLIRKERFNVFGKFAHLYFCWDSLPWNGSRFEPPVNQQTRCLSFRFLYESNNQDRRYSDSLRDATL